MKEYAGPNTLLKAFQLIRQAIKNASPAAGDGLSKEGDTLSVTTPVRGIVTQAEFDALTEAQKNSGLYVISDGGGGGGVSSAGEVYSTEETRIGTWIDGKPLYQKVFQGIPIGTGWVSMGALAPEARAVMIAGWLTDIVGNVNPIPYQNLLGLIVNSGDSNIVSFNNFSQTEAFKNRPVTAVVKYTKTTDEGGTA